MHNIPFLKVDEKIILWVNKHYYIYLFIFFIFLAVCLIPAIAFFSLLYFFPDSFSVWSYWFLIWYETFMVLFVYQKFLEEVMDMLIITDKRVINVEQLTLFQRKVSSALLSQIQDVSYIRKTFFATIFDYGKIIIQTAGDNVYFTMNYVSDPETVQEKISGLIKG